MIWNRFRLWFSRWNLLVFCLLVFWLDPKCATKITKIASGMPFCICVFLCVATSVGIVGMKPSKTDFTACMYPQVKHGEWKPDANPRNRHIHLQRKTVTVGPADSKKYFWKHRSFWLKTFGAREHCIKLNCYLVTWPFVVHHHVCLQNVYR